MARSIRLLRSFLTLSSLILLIATTALWIRSYTHLDEINHYRPQRYVCLESVEGRLYYNHWTAPEPYWSESSTQIGGGELSRLKYGHISFSWQFGPFAHRHASPTGPVFATPATGDVVMFPHWAIILLALLLPALSLRRILKNRSARLRAEKGFCPQCGYDLRATPTRCPECGKDRTVQNETGRKN